MLSICIASWWRICRYKVNNWGRFGLWRRRSWMVFKCSGWSCISQSWIIFSATKLANHCSSWLEGIGCSLSRISWQSFWVKKGCPPVQLKTCLSIVWRLLTFSVNPYNKGWASCSLKLANSIALPILKGVFWGSVIKAEGVVAPKKAKVSSWNWGRIALWL